MWDWGTQNWELLLALLGIIITIIAAFFGTKKIIKQKQKSRDNSTNIQVAGDIKVVKGEKEND